MCGGKADFEYYCIISRMRYNFERGSLGAMLRGSTLGDTQQIIGEAADCSGWTRMEGQGDRVFSSFM